MITISGSSVSIFTTKGSGGADPLVRSRPPGRLLLGFGAAWAITEGRPGGRPRTRGSAPPLGALLIEAGCRGTVSTATISVAATAKAAAHGHAARLRCSIFARTPER